MEQPGSWRWSLPSTRLVYIKEPHVAFVFEKCGWHENITRRMKMDFLGSRFQPVFGWSPVFHFKQEDCHDRKHLIWFKALIKDEERSTDIKHLIVDGLRTRVGWSDADLSWMSDASTQRFRFHMSDYNRPGFCLCLRSMFSHNDSVFQSLGHVVTMDALAIAAIKTLTWKSASTKESQTPRCHIWWHCI